MADNPPLSRFSSLALNGEFTGEAHAQNDIGKMAVIFVKLRDDTDTPRATSLAQINGITDDNSKVSPVEPTEAAYAISTEDKTSAWKGAIVGMAAGALGGAAIGGITGAVAGAVLDPSGAAAGAAINAIGYMPYAISHSLMALAIYPAVTSCIAASFQHNKTQVKS